MLKYPYVGEYRKSEFKLGLGIDNSPNQYNNPMGYELGNELAVRGILNYNHLEILLTYNYKTFTSGRANQNKRKITRVDLPSYIKF